MVTLPNVTFVWLTTFAHVESQLSGRKRQREVVFSAPVNLCIEEHVLQCVAVGGIHAKEDKLPSIAYPEELISSEVSHPSEHGPTPWDCGPRALSFSTRFVSMANRASGVWPIALAFPSSVHRHLQAIDRRDRYPESSLWETEAARTWLIRLVVATLFVFGLKRGVGAETLSEFFGRLRLEGLWGVHPAPCEPSCTHWSASS